MPPEPNDWIALDKVRADGWFEQIGQQSPQFAQLLEVVGEPFVAFAVVAGIRFRSIAVDPDFRAASAVEFSGGPKDEPQQLPLGELQRQLATALRAFRPLRRDLGPSPSPEAIQNFLGARNVLLSAFFGIGLKSLQAGPPVRVRVRIGDKEEVLSVDDLDQRIDQAIEQAVEAAHSTAPTLDLDRIDKARGAAKAERWNEVLELLQGWPRLLSMLFHTPQGRSAPADHKQVFVEALQLLAKAHGSRDEPEPEQEALRSALRWCPDGPSAAELYAQLGRSLVSEQRPAEAIAPLRRARALGAAANRCLPWLALAYCGGGRYVAAAACLRQARALDMEPSACRAFEQAERLVEAELGEAWHRAERALQ